MIKVELLDHMGSDLTVCNAARVSFNKESSYSIVEVNGTPTLQLAERDIKLIHYLAKHKHISPFGHCFLSFRITAPIFVARQLVKHKFLRWNEVSRRYVDTPPEFYEPEVWRARSDNVKQGSSSEAVLTIECGGEYSPHTDTRIELEYDNLIGEVEWLYEKLIKAGVCPEQARMVLPQSMMTSWFWSGSLDAFVDMCRLRLDKHTQYETRVVAEGVAEKIAEHFPVSWQALYGEEASTT
jgi:thymidylate synthase (FAD)